MQVKGISLALAAEGCKLAVCARGQEALDETVGEVEAAGAEALGVSADVTNKSDIDGVIEAVLDKWGRLDVLVISLALREGSRGARRNRW